MNVTLIDIEAAIPFKITLVNSRGSDKQTNCDAAL